MDSEIKEKLDETYNHIKNYISKEETPLLIDMCSRCEKWCGNNHNYDECLECSCFKLFLGYEYMCWENSYK